MGAKTKQAIAEMSKEIKDAASSFAAAQALRIKEKQEYEVAMQEYNLSEQTLSRAIGVLQEYYADKGASFIQMAQPQWVLPAAYESKLDSSGGVVSILETVLTDTLGTSAPPPGEDGLS